MLFYILVICFTIFFYYLARGERGSSSLYYVGCILCVLLPSLVESLRSVDVGKDIQAYGVAYFEYAVQSKDIVSFFYNSPSKEYGYMLLNYLCGHITDDIHFFFFVVGLIKAYCVSYVALSFKQHQVGACFMFAYMMSFYWESFSMLRQGLAMAIVCVVIVKYLRRKYFSSIVLLLVAYSCHNSAIFVLIFPVIHFVYKFFAYPLLWISVGMVVVYIAIRELFVLVAATGLFKTDILSLYEDSGVTLAKVNILIAIYFFIYSFMFEYMEKAKVLKVRKNLIHGRAIKSGYFRVLSRFVYKKEKIEYDSFLMKASSLICLCFLALSGMIEVAFRISYYQVLFLIMLVPITMTRLPGKVFLVTKSCFLLLFLLYYVINAQHGLVDTIPYRSDILGISIG